ncbi:MAG: cytochrome c oxidase subunit II [Bacteroidales bacterium]
MYSEASNFVEGVDRAFVFILSVAIFFLVSITIAMVYFIIRYNKKKNPKATQIKGSVTLEVLWTAIPLVLVLLMFYYGWTGWRPMQKAPEDTFNIKSISRMWSWAFEYDNGKMTDTLYVPQGQPVKLDLISQDVIHSLYIPAFRVKQDIVPGRNGMMWFVAEKPGRYDLFCTEYCGLRHSYMETEVVVLTPEEFEKWYADTTTGDLASESTTELAGKNLIRTNGCTACHSLDGTKLVGPSFKGVYGHEVTILDNGTEKTITADEEYLRESIYQPNKLVVKGYNKGLMQSYEGILTEEETSQIIEYIKTLNGK